MTGIDGRRSPAMGGLGMLLEIKKAQLAHLLGIKTGLDLRLDHDLPLGARIQYKRLVRGREIIRYMPDANDPEHLIYREKRAHEIKTNVRGEHGQHPDRVLIKKERKRGRKKRPKVKIRSRGFRKHLATAIERGKKRRRQLPLPPRRIT